ncbi:hypothetical protein [Saccharopolyspora tripterygii]
MQPGNLDAETLRQLVKHLPPVDLSTKTPEELVQLIQHTHAARNNWKLTAGWLIAETVRRDGWDYRRLAELTGIPRNTLHRWAKPFLTNDHINDSPGESENPK